MLFAALGNIHGDADALDCVLSELDARGMQLIVNTGDTVGDPIGTPKVLERLAARETHTVQGAGDRAVSHFARKRKRLKERLDPKEFDRLQTCYEGISPEQIEVLGQLSGATMARFDGRTVAVCHGTWNRRNRYLEPGDEDHWFRRQRELQPADVFVLGGPSGPFSRLVDDTLFVNPGSIASDANGCAEFAVINIEELPARVEQCRIRVR